MYKAASPIPKRRKNETKKEQEEEKHEHHARGKYRAAFATRRGKRNCRAPILLLLVCVFL